MRGSASDPAIWRSGIGEPNPRATFRAPVEIRLRLSTPPTRARLRAVPSIMPAASNTPIILVEQAMTVEYAGTVGSIPASIKISRAMLLQVRLGTTFPQTAKSGLPPWSNPTMCLTTGTDNAMASNPPSGPSTFAKGVRTPAASQMSGLRGDKLIIRTCLFRRAAPK